MNSPILFNCPHCGQPFEAEVNLAGKRTKCPSCDQDFQVSFSEAAPIRLTAAAERKTKPAPILAGALAGAAVVAAAGLVFMQARAKTVHAPPTNPAASPVVENSPAPVAPVSPSPKPVLSKPTEGGNPVPEVPEIEKPLVESNDIASSTLAAWKEMNQINNRNDRLSRDNPVEYWEVMAKEYGEIKLENVDTELTDLISSFRDLFADYSEAERDRGKGEPKISEDDKKDKPKDDSISGLVATLAGSASKVVKSINPQDEARLLLLDSRHEGLKRSKRDLRGSLAKEYKVAFP